MAIETIKQIQEKFGNQPLNMVQPINQIPLNNGNKLKNVLIITGGLLAVVGIGFIAVQMSKFFSGNPEEE